MSAVPAQLAIHPTEPSDALRDLTDEQRSEIGRRQRIVESWQVWCADAARISGYTKDRATQSFLRTTPGVSKSTLYEWAARLDDSGPIGLLDGRANNGQAADRTACSEEAWQFFLGLYLDIRRPSVASCHLITKYEAGRSGWQWPPLRSIQRRVQRMPRFETDYYRLGQKQWEKTHSPKAHRDWSMYRSGQTWCADFREADVFCRKSDRDPTICRPLVSGFRDMRSRVIVGRHVSLRECQDTVLLGLRCGIERYGPPEELLIDNGKPYRAKGVSGGRGSIIRLIESEDYIRSVLGALQILPRFATPYGPNSKPIEGWFAVMGDQFDRTFATYCGGQKDDLFRSASKLAREHPELCPTVAEYAEKFGRYIDAYHITPNAGDDLKGMTPAEAWATFDPIAKRILPDGALDILLMRVTDPVCVRAGEVLCDGVRYYDSRLLPLNGQRVCLRRDSDDASFVLICDLEGRPQFRALNHRMSVMGVTRDDVSSAMQEKARARRTAKRVRDGATRAAQRDISDLAIEARLAAGDRTFIDKLARATGTDGERNSMPLRSDFAESVRTFNRSELQASASPPSSSEARSLANIIGADRDAPTESPADTPAIRQLARIVGAEPGVNDE